MSEYRFHKFDSNYIDRFIQFLKTLSSYSIIPVIIFDGQTLPAKKLTNDSRNKKRENSLQEFQNLILKIDSKLTSESQVEKELQKYLNGSISILPRDVYYLCKKLKSMN